MISHFLIFGSHPELSQAEAEAIFQEKPTTVIDMVGLFARESWDGAQIQNQLGGTVKLGDIVAIMPIDRLDARVMADLIEQRPRHARILFGMTLVGNAKTHKQLPIQTKKELVKRGKSARWVTGDHGLIAPAAVTKLCLTDEGYDFVIIFDRDRVHVGLTTHVQNADAWSLRDFGRPFRDAKTGMLPPKLARIMVNLAVNGRDKSILLDPFCGSGTILMEAALLGVRHIFGSDINETQIRGCGMNMDWLVSEGFLTTNERANIRLFPANVEQLHERLPSDLDAPVNTIVTEGYLGKPLQGNESIMVLETQKREIEDLWRKSLRAFCRILPVDGMVVCIWPAYLVGKKTIAVDLTQELKNLGFSLVHPIMDYSRSGQHLKRRVVVLRKIQGKI